MASKLTDIAREAKVSNTTVSMILNRNERFTYAGATVARVMAAAKRLNYCPHPAARLMRCKKTNVIGIAVQPEAEYIAHETVNICAKLITEAGYDPLMVNLPEESDVYAGSLAGRLDILCGLICQYANQEQKAVRFSEQHGLALPIITLFRKRTASPLVREVFSDNRSGFAEIAAYMHELGHSQLIYLQKKPLETERNLKLEGFEATAKDLGIEHLVISQDGRNGYESGARAGKEVLSLMRQGFSAVAGGNDETALGLMSALLAKGVRIPEDLSVVGYDDLPFAAHCYPALTTWRQRRQEMCRAAVKLLISCVKGAAIHQEMLPASLAFQPERIIRNSTARLAGRKSYRTSKSANAKG